MTLRAKYIRKLDRENLNKLVEVILLVITELLLKLRDLALILIFLMHYSASVDIGFHLRVRERG